MNWRKVICSVLTLVVLSGLFAGVALAEKGQMVGNQDLSEHVEVVMYIVGDAPVDDAIVWEKVNAILKERINTTVKVNHIPWADVNQRYQLLFTSGEDFDCVFSASFMNYTSIATKNAYMEITDELLETYAPSVLEDLDPSYVRGSKVDGKLYMLPANQHDVRTNVVVIRGDLREQYNLEPLETIEDLYTYMVTVAPSMTPYNTRANDDNILSYMLTLRYGYRSPLNLEGVSTNRVIDEMPTVFNLFETPEFLVFCQRTREWNQAGVFARSMLSAQMTCSDNFESGTSAVAINEPNGLFTTMQKVASANPEWKPEVYDLSNKEVPLSGLTPYDAGMSINANAKNPERALMVIAELRQVKELADLTYCGIEGVHWEEAGDKQFTPLEAAPNYPWNANCPWGWGNDRFLRTDASTSSQFVELRDEWKTREQPDPRLAFIFNDTEVKNEIAALTNIREKYVPMLSYGFVEDIEGTISKMNDEMKAAGLDKVQQEYTAQMEKWWTEYTNN